MMPMSDRRSPDDLSEDTRRLVDELGQLLDSPPSPAAMLSEPEPTTTDAVFSVYSSVRQRPSSLSTHPAVLAVNEQMDTNRHASCWLYGDNARERGRVIDFLGGQFSRGSGWTAAYVPFVGRVGSDPFFSKEGRMIAMSIRRAWTEREHGMRGRGSMSGYDLATSSTTSTAILLDEFPARHEAADDYLYQLSRQLAALGERSILVVSSEVAPRGMSRKNFVPVVCESPSTPAGKRIAELRANAGLSRSELANIVAIPPSRLAMIESGVEEPVDVELVERLTDVLKISRQDIDDGDSDEGSR